MMPSPDRSICRAVHGLLTFGHGSRFERGISHKRHKKDFFLCLLWLISPSDQAAMSRFSETSLNRSDRVRKPISVPFLTIGALLQFCVMSSRRALVASISGSRTQYVEGSDRKAPIFAVGQSFGETALIDRTSIIPTKRPSSTTGKTR